MRLLGAAILCLALGACGAGASVHPAKTSVTLRYVRPSAANPHVKRRFEYENVYASPSGKPVNRLFLFLPGTWAPPRAYREIVRSAAEHGYHAIALDYPNMTEIDSNKICGKSTDPNCWGDYRNEVITGSASSRLVSVDKANSITQRLVDMLAYAAQKFPGEGWERYVSHGVPVWSDIYVAGHSQGAGDAGYLGYLHSMGGVCTIEGPDDGNALIRVAAWQERPQATSPSHKYGFFNQADRFVPWARASHIWSVLRYPGLPVNVDRTAPPYGASHQLYTDRPARTVLKSHDLTVMDTAIPRTTDGTAVFAPVWQYACFP